MTSVFLRGIEISAWADLALRGTMGGDNGSVSVSLDQTWDCSEIARLVVEVALASWAWNLS